MHMQDKIHYDKCKLIQLKCIVHFYIGAYNHCSLTKAVQIILANYGKVRYFRTSGKFIHTFANSGNPDETALYEPSHLDFYCLLS